MRTALASLLLLASCRWCESKAVSSSFVAQTGLPAELERQLGAPELERQRFSDLCVEAIHAVYPDAGVVTLEPLTFQLSHPDVAMISFDNPWRAKPDARAADVWNQLRKIEAVLASFGQLGTREQVVPLLRGKSTLPDGGTEFAGNGEPWVGDLRLVYMFNRPEVFTPVTDDDLTRLALSRPQLQALALRNLRALASPIEKVQIRNPLEGNITEDRIWMVRIPSAGGYFETSVLLLDEYWAAQEMELGKGLVVATPTRDLLFLTLASNADDVRRLRAIAQDAAANYAHPVSGALLTRINGAWQPF
ncbi:MAG: hypothetical protein Q8S33_06540 [Myxococcales bacterium]|nr:hypothetical protein [Myxococcales bacterium]